MQIRLCGAVRPMALLLVLVALPLQVWSDEVTEKEALKLAQQFVASHNTRKSVPTVKAAGQVSGLYVFNVIGDGGFVIVSNDDATMPILGYGERGNIDTECLPDNMRAWLQGYADEIAWLQQQETNGVVVTRTKAPRREAEEPESGEPESPTGWQPGDAKTDILPLVTSRWNQGEPYHALTPYYKKEDSGYSYSKDYVEGYTHCATGCVATAMAQVMYYHKWPTAATATIPAYQWRTYWLPDEKKSLPAITLDWANMIDEYDPWNAEKGKRDILGSPEQQLAVATLMQYCGYSVEMNYGRESSSNTIMVANALTSRFGYKSTTTYVSRSFYTYAKWVDLIYYELSHGRPVVYGGQSSEGGHEFVCDGYKYDDGDLFHINWGWGSLSDGYFVLSALNPDEQGTGGSSSRDGYHYGQDAVIGIQPSTGTGTLSDITSNTVSLTANSISLSNTPVIVGNPVTITLTITNNSADDYDGDIYVGRYQNGVWILFVGDVFDIPAGATEECDFTFTPTSTGSYAFAFFCPRNNGYYYTTGDPLAQLSVVDVILGNDATDNSAIVTSNDTKTVSVSLSGRTLYRDDNWNTLCLPFDVTSFTGTPLEGATVLALDVEHTWISDNGQWTIDNENGDHQTGYNAYTGTLDLFFNEVNEIKAGTPYLIKWASASDISDPSFFDVTIANGMHDVEFTGGAFKGSYNSQTFDGDNKRILFLGADNKLYWPQAGATIGAQRAYFQLDEEVEVRAFNLNIGEEDDFATGTMPIGQMDNLQFDNSSDAGAWYDLSGRKIVNCKSDTLPLGGVGGGLPKGIYIVNGRKIVVK